MLNKAIIYQVLPRLWNPSNFDSLKVGGSLAENGSGHFGSIDGKVLEYLRDALHVSHVWYTGIIRHADGSNDWVKGAAGSPYAIEDYFDVNPYLADNEYDRMDEFVSLVRRTHDAGMKIVIDFVPNHLARSCSSFFGTKDDPTVHWKPENDFFYYPGQELQLPIASTYREFPAKASGNAFSPAPCQTDWYDTVKLNYCNFRTPTWDKMVKVLQFWCSMGVDGFRCDMVELVPREAISFLIKEVRKRFPETEFIAEVYDRSSYSYYATEAGFDALYDKCGLYDALHGVVHDGYGTDAISENWKRLGALQPFMLNFLENHDEVRLAGNFFAGNANNSFAALYVSLLMNTSPFLIYFGQEVGERGMDAEGFSRQDGRTSIFDWWCPASVRHIDGYIHDGTSLEPTEAETLELYSRLLAYSQEDIIRKGSFYDLQYCNEGSARYDTRRQYSFLRVYRGDMHLITVNFSSAEACIDVNIPEEAFRWAGFAVHDGIHVQVKVPTGGGRIVQVCRNFSSDIHTLI